MTNALKERSTNTNPDFRPKAWGKSSPEGDFHALEAHSFDVAAVFEALCALPVLGRHLNSTSGRELSSGDLSRLAALVYLHDLGKLEPGFQAKARPELACPANVNHSVHGLLGLIRGFDQQADPLHRVALEIDGWGEGAIELMMAIFAHHGRPIAAQQTYGPTRDVRGYDRTGAIADYLRM